jgi:hypothetical protein
MTFFYEMQNVIQFNIQLNIQPAITKVFIFLLYKLLFLLKLLPACKIFNKIAYFIS